MIELQQKDYHKVIPLFEGIDHSIAEIFSVIEGNIPGKIFVDDRESPKTVFMYPKDSFFYVGGYENNSKFNNEMYKMIFENILDDSSEGELVLFYFTEGWSEKLDILFKDKEAIKITRKVFEFNKDLFTFNKIDIEQSLPGEFTLKEIDGIVAEKIGVIKTWNSIEDFLQKGIGQCIIKNEEIIAACYSIYYGSRKGEVNIFTKGPYRGKGFGKIVATAYIDSCISKGITPGWSCWPYRKESYNLAKKLGFEEKEDVKAYYWSKNK